MFHWPDQITLRDTARCLRWGLREFEVRALEQDIEIALRYSAPVTHAQT